MKNKNNKVDTKKSSKEQPLSPPSFSNLIMSIASAAILKMGLDPENKAELNLELARYNIDLLDLLKQKTKNNLNQEEAKLLEACVSDLQLQFIAIKNQKKEN